MYGLCSWSRDLGKLEGVEKADFGLTSIRRQHVGTSLAFFWLQLNMTIFHLPEGTNRVTVTVASQSSCFCLQSPGQDSPYISKGSSPLIFLGFLQRRLIQPQINMTATVTQPILLLGFGLLPSWCWLFLVPFEATYGNGDCWRMEKARELSPYTPKMNKTPCLPLLVAPPCFPITGYLNRTESSNKQSLRTCPLPKDCLFRCVFM